MNQKKGTASGGTGAALTERQRMLLNGNFTEDDLRAEVVIGDGCCGQESAEANCK